MADAQNSSTRAVRGDIYHIYVPSLSPLMLCIGGTTCEQADDDSSTHRALEVANIH